MPSPSVSNSITIEVRGLAHLWLNSTAELPDYITRYTATPQRLHDCDLPTNQWIQGHVIYRPQHAAANDGGELRYLGIVGIPSSAPPASAALTHKCCLGKHEDELPRFFDLYLLEYSRASADAEPSLVGVVRDVQKVAGTGDSITLHSPSSNTSGNDDTISAICPDGDTAQLPPAHFCSFETRIVKTGVAAAEYLGQLHYRHEHDTGQTSPSPALVCIGSMRLAFIPNPAP
ncbi:hypothetical protein EV182_004020 [Spiromyces aspiralis]|uniref:Uncharacterized protein n=1 Tax=Spiromyces aspiralis TaxID=68401 RepID=A0ACC1HRR1_9FUNG|nr:hypothetical protein EV182_004020 [Spiromyces aspiralis]